MVTEYSLLFLGPPPINLLSWIIQAPQKDSDSLEAFTSLHLFLTAPGDFFSLSLSSLLFHYGIFCLSVVVLTVHFLLPMSRCVCLCVCVCVSCPLVSVYTE